ncbi:MAG TPA: TauD/TfdA family dioxygenase [Arenicellales bacterium]|nr:TauD/TfdA family dioxygenase [Arenicellales bacterium]
MNDTAKDISTALPLIDGRVRFQTGNGSTHTLHPVWLRERCPCAECRDARTGQRLLDAWSISPDTVVTSAEAEGGEVRITFSDGHVAPFRAADLEASLGRRDDRAGIVTWDAGLSDWPKAEWSEASSDDAALHDMLEQLHRYGFVLVRGVPAELDAVADVVERVGPMRRTNWGGVADVKAIAKAFDLTMTTRALEPHTDNPYREPVPGYIFLHCIVNDVEGGDLLLSDGFRVAELLREQAPEEFDALTRVRSEFRYVDETTTLENSGPLIELDDDGRVRQVRLSNRTEWVPAEDPDLLDSYYRARLRFTTLVNDPKLQIRSRWRVGDLLILDNYRMLHGRGAYQQTAAPDEAQGRGYRHMRQCYMDRDTVGSRRKVLARRYA